MEEDKQRELEYQNKLSKLERNRILSPLIEMFLSQGKISVDEYIKWILDKTFEYIPKLNK